MPQTYSLMMRLIHWLTAMLIIILLILGFWMTDRSAADLWDELTNTLYSWHKLIGFLVLLITGLRIITKLNSKRPPYPSSLSLGQIRLAQAVQSALYLLLVLIPLFGWAGVTAFPALITVGGYHLPGMPGVPQDQALAKQLFQIHYYLILALIAIALVHIAAGLSHLWLKKDGVFQRIWFKR
jgi:cytochrome b561